MAGVGYQAVAAEMLGEDPFAGRDRLLARHVAKTPLGPGLLAAFDDEGRGLGSERHSFRFENRPQTQSFRYAIYLFRKYYIPVFQNTLAL
jgi:hypothetical protein